MVNYGNFDQRHRRSKAQHFRLNVGIAGSTLVPRCALAPPERRGLRLQGKGGNVVSLRSTTPF
jgi:hypothetical protein